MINLSHFYHGCWSDPFLIGFVFSSIASLATVATAVIATRTPFSRHTYNQYFTILDIHKKFCFRSILLQVYLENSSSFLSRIPRLLIYPSNQYQGKCWRGVHCEYFTFSFKSFNSCCDLTEKKEAYVFFKFQCSFNFLFLSNRTW